MLPQLLETTQGKVSPGGFNDPKNLQQRSTDKVKKKQPTILVTAAAQANNKVAQQQQMPTKQHLINMQQRKQNFPESLQSKINQNVQNLANMEQKIGRNDGYSSKFPTDAANYGVGATKSVRLGAAGTMAQTIEDMLPSSSKKFQKQLYTNPLAEPQPPGPQTSRQKKNNTLMSQEQLLGYGGDYTEAGSGLPNLKQSIMKSNDKISKRMIKDRYQNLSGVDPNKKQITTNPADAGYLNLRIKSSKAFPMDEVGAIEELLTKVSKRSTEGNLKESQQKLLKLDEPALDYHQFGGMNNKTVGSKMPPTMNSQDQNSVMTKKDLALKILTTHDGFRGMGQQTAKPHSYEFLKQQMRELKKELSNEKRANQFNSNSGVGGVNNSIAQPDHMLSRMNSKPQLSNYQSTLQSPRNSNVVQKRQQSTLIKNNTSNQDTKLFEARATSLPKISPSSRVKLTQFQVLDQKGEKSHVAQHYKNVSKWDHQNLINVKGMLEAKVFSPQMARATVQSKVYGLTKDQTSGSKPSLINSASNRSLFQTRQRSYNNQSQSTVIKNVSSHPYLKVENQQRDDSGNNYSALCKVNKAQSQRFKGQASGSLGNQELQNMFDQLSAEKKAYLSSLLEAQGGSNAQTTKKSNIGALNDRVNIMQKANQTMGGQPKKPYGAQFRFHKHLDTSQYNEYLAASDDEDFFKSKPVTKDGRNFELDFKIDTYRDEIKFNKHGSQKKLLTAQKQGSNRSLLSDNQNHMDANNTDKHHHAVSSIQALNESNFFAGANVLNTIEGVLGTDTDVAIANEFLNSITRNISVERYKQIEDLIQIPYHEEMGEMNRTLLRCQDGCFKINYQEMNHLKVATMKQMKSANQAMVQKNSLPIFSGNIECYLVNQLCEFELMSKVKNVMSKEDTNRVNLSSIYPYYQRLTDAANIKFTEPALKLAAELRALQQKNQDQEDGKHPSTPQIELVKQQLQPATSSMMLDGRDNFTGVLIKKQAEQIGQKPCCRIHMEVLPLGNRFITYGGAAANVFNDIRSIDSVEFIWKLLKEDTELHDFAGRFGHIACGFERYMVIFGGCGPYSKKLKKRSSYQDTIVYDVENGKYFKFEGGPASLAAEVSDMKEQKKAKRKLQQSAGTLETILHEQSVQKNRLAVISSVQTSTRPDQDTLMTLRQRAVVEMPEARAHHVGCVFGAGLFIHGGLSGEGNRTLSDWNLFDFSLQVWINCQVDEVKADESLTKFNLCRKYHTLTPVVDPNITNGRELTRLMWVSQLQELIRKPSVLDQGMFMFGGINEEGNQTEDLFWINPDIKTNAKCINNKTGEYKGGNFKPEVKLLARRLTPEGRGPIARAQHSATFFKNQLVIFGGRNDAIFSAIKNVALNDLHILDVASNRWCSIALYGDIPQSRWGHKLVSNENKIMLFGGMNLDSYCESVLYDVHIDDQVVIEYLSKPIGLKEEQKQKSVQSILEDAVKATKLIGIGDQLRINSQVIRDKKELDEFIDTKIENNNTVTINGQKEYNQEKQETEPLEALLSRDTAVGGAIDSSAYDLGRKTLPPPPKGKITATVTIADEKKKGQDEANSLIKQIELVDQIETQVDQNK